MINKNFKENWRQILNFNSKVEILKNPQETTEKVRIPLTPVSINSYILYFLVETLYPKFINDQQNILDIFYSNGSSETASMNAILYETSKAGIHESMIKIPTDLIPNEQITRENIQEVFDEIQPAIIKHYGTKISGVRVFTAKTLDLINLYCQNLDFTSNGKYIPHIIDLFQDLIQEDLIVIFPEPNCLRFMKQFLNVFCDMRMSQIYTYFLGILPEMKLSLLLDSEKLRTVINIRKEKENNLELDIRFNTLHELDISDNLNLPDILPVIQKKSPSERIIGLNINNLIKFSSDLFELELPLDQERFRLILQKFLYGIRNFERMWFCYPRPVIYNTFLRFILRLFGINTNLKKISHWAIPDLVLNYFNTMFGLNSNILVFITDVEKAAIKDLQDLERLIPILEFGILIKIENGAIQAVKPLKYSEIFNPKYGLLDAIHVQYSRREGYISSVVIIDKQFIRSIVNLIKSEKPGFFLFKLRKLIKMIKNETHLKLFPKPLLVRLLTEKKTLSTIKILLDNCIDKHEF